MRIDNQDARVIVLLTTSTTTDLVCQVRVTDGPRLCSAIHQGHMLNKLFILSEMSLNPHIKRFFIERTQTNAQIR